MWIWMLLVGIALFAFFVYHTVRTKKAISEEDAIHYVCDECGEKDCICHPEDRNSSRE